MAKHTPTPWILDPDSPLDILFDDRAGENVTPMIGCVFDANTDREQAEADAAFIVHAVNCHDDMLAALLALEAHCKVENPATRGNPAAHAAEGEAIRKMVQAAIAKASPSTRRDGPVLREGVEI